MVINLKEDCREIYLYTKYIFVRILPGSYEQVVPFLENKWKSYVKARPFEHYILSEDLDKLYNEEENLGKLAAILTILIIFVAGLGLFGLVSFMAEQRTKEIGIRKILGASSQRIIILLTKEFAGLVAISILIGWPLAYFGLDKWLENFSNRIPINLWIFLLSGIIIIIYAITITIIKSNKVTKQNPVDSVNIRGSRLPKHRGVSLCFTAECVAGRVARKVRFGLDDYSSDSTRSAVDVGHALLVD